MRRLGTRMLGAAVMLEARVLLSAPDSPPFRLLAAARASDLRTWASVVREIRYKLGNLPDIVSYLSTNFGAGISTVDKTTRKKHLAQYRHNILEPALRNYDEETYCEHLRGMDWPYIDFQPGLTPLPMHVLCAPWSKSQWQDYTIWSLARVTGRLPWAPLGLHWAPKVVDFCPLCNDPNADLNHLLQSCPCTEQLRLRFNVPRYLVWREFALMLFEGRPFQSSDDVPNQPDWRIEFVATTARLAADAMQRLMGPSQIDRLIDTASRGLF